MAPGFFKKIGQWFKQAIPKVVQAVPKILDVAGKVVSYVSPTAGKVLQSIGKIAQPIAKPASEGINKLVNGSEAKAIKPINEKDIEKAGDYAQQGLKFLTPVMRKFKVK